MSIIISTSFAALLLFILTSVDPTLDFNTTGSSVLLFIVGFSCHGRNFQISFHLYCTFTFSITLLSTLDIYLTNKHIFCPFIFLCMPASCVSCRFLPHYIFFIEPFLICLLAHFFLMFLLNLQCSVPFVAFS